MDTDFSQFQPPDLIGKRHKIRQSPPAEPKTADEISARRSADEFEAIFISQMLKSMSVGVKTDGPFGGGQSEEIYRDLMNEELGQVMTSKGGIGLSDAIYREILKSQEVSK